MASASSGRDVGGGGMKPDAIPENEILPIPGQPGFYILRADYAAWLEYRSDDAHTTAIAEYEHLGRAMADTPPPCLGDLRFVADEAPMSDRIEMQETCLTRCGIRRECHAYAAKARPPAGIWAGLSYRSITTGSNHP